MVALLVVTIRFLNGSYHATPWGKHVNEGVPEWPPSVWRLVRAIISVWKRTVPELEEQTVWPIIKKMAAELPHYNLPDAQVSHTRHYMPLAKKRALVLATFVATGDKPVHIIWRNVTLDEEEMAILNQVLANMHYFGRAESWCAASASSLPQTYNCSPVHELDMPLDVDIVNVLVPKHDIKFYDTNKSAETGKDLDHISVTTMALQKSNYIDPPGGIWVQYSRQRNCFEEKHSHGMTMSRNRVTLVRYAVVGPVRPPIRDTLHIGDLARAACMSKYGRAHNGDTSPILSGKDPEGRPLKNHLHASYLPTYETQFSEIDHLTIFAPGGFGRKDLAVLPSVTRLYKYGLGHDVALVFQGLGAAEDFRTVPIMEMAGIWVSATPLMLTRHVKHQRSGSGEVRVVDSPEEQIRAEIKNRYGDSYRLKSVTLDDSPERMHNTNVRPSHFHRRRRRGSIGDGRLYKARLEFEKDVPGPITLGYASHYGLGMFVPAGGPSSE